MEQIPIVFICDENYVMPTTVAICSLKKSRKKNTAYLVYVIGSGLSEYSQKKILTLSENDFPIEIVKRGLSEEQEKIVQYRERVTIVATLKFDLPNIFKEHDKILYLDSDVVVQKDLTSLFLTNIDGQYAAVVKDTMTVRGKNGHLKRIDFKPKIYFNSGVMLLNLKKMREGLISDKLLEYRLHGKNFFMDQDALNVIFEGNVKYISPYYNLLNCFFEWQPIGELNVFYDINFPRSKNQVYKKAVVLHFGDKKKPWQYDMGYLSKIYIKYYSLSPYADVALNLKKDDTPSTMNQGMIETVYRKLRGGIRCYREHGMAYTLRRIKEKFLGLFGR